MKSGDTMRHKDDAYMDSRTYNRVHRYLMRSSQPSVKWFDHIA